MFTGEEINILTKNLNIWCTSANKWIDDDYIQQSLIDELPEFDDPIVYIGVDLAATSDLTAVNYMIEQDDIYYNYTLYYLPERFKTGNPYNR